LYLNLQLLERAANNKSLLTENEILEMISSCRSEVERLDGIITQFLGAIRPKDLVFSSVFIDKILIELLAFMRQELELKKIHVECDIAENIPAIQGDEKQLKQLFYNVIRNAVQATTANGVLNIKISADLEFVMIEFADSGRGIESNQINRIFKPFQSFRSDGNGIGMMIIERIVREHGGELSIDSQPNVGTIVAIRFRRHAKKMRVLNS
jgi:signal transduction histidine kinase